VAGLGGSPELPLALAMLSESEDDTVVPLESFTVSEAICVPAVVGVPLIVPLLLNERPPGKLPADQV
jgi:hypothetical protein